MIIQVEFKKKKTTKINCQSLPENPFREIQIESRAKHTSKNNGVKWQIKIKKGYT